MPFTMFWYLCKTKGWEKKFFFFHLLQHTLLSFAGSCKFFFVGGGWVLELRYFFFLLILDTHYGFLLLYVVFIVFGKKITQKDLIFIVFWCSDNEGSEDFVLQESAPLKDRIFASFKQISEKGVALLVWKILIWGENGVKLGFWGGNWIQGISYIFFICFEKMGSYQLIREKNDARLRWDPQQGDVQVQGETKHLSPRIEVITSDATNNDDLELSFQKFAVSSTSPLSTLPKSSVDHVGQHFRRSKTGSSSTGGSGRVLSLDIFRGITVAVISRLLVWDWGVVVVVVVGSNLLLMCLLLDRFQDSYSLWWLVLGLSFRWMIQCAYCLSWYFPFYHDLYTLR